MIQSECDGRIVCKESRLFEVLSFFRKAKANKRLNSNLIFKDFEKKEISYDRLGNTFGGLD
jgi:hypothetical protein